MTDLCASHYRQKKSKYVVLHSGHISRICGSVVAMTVVVIVTNWASRSRPAFPRHKQNKTKRKKKVTLGRSVHSGQFSNLGWELRTLGPISWFHFCCSQNPSPSSSTQWTEDLGGSILFFSLRPATRSRKHQAPWHGF